ncbi:MAG: hypothetical protein HYX32_05200 [Actinobacteria bacterium]|nr:hypothetical protein [Actinomycetota bacterium]
MIGLLLLLAGSWLMMDLVRRRPVDLGAVPSAVPASDPTVTIRVPGDGRYLVVVRGTVGLPSRFPAVVESGDGYARSDPPSDDELRLDPLSEKLQVEAGGTVRASRATDVEIRLTEPGVTDVFLVPLKDTPLRLDPSQLVLYTLMIVVGTAALVFGAIRRRAWSKRVRAYAAEIEASQHRPVG